jgi:hemophore-related protein
LNDQSPETANELSANPLAVGWLQGLVAAPPDQRAQMVQQMQVVYTCNRY